MLGVGLTPTAWMMGWNIAWRAMQTVVWMTISEINEVVDDEDSKQKITKVGAGGV